MQKTMQLVLVSAVALAASMPASFACGDKLVALGGGVPFNRVHVSRQPGNIVLYLNPQGALVRAVADVRLDDALTRAGHTVRKVATRADLDLALRDAAPDLVLMDLRDAVELDARLSDRVPTLPVAYGASAQELENVRAAGRCVLDADKRRATRLVRAVNTIVEDHIKGVSADCISIGGRGAS